LLHDDAVINALVIALDIKARSKGELLRHGLNRSNRTLDTTLTCDMSATPIEVVRELNF